MARTIPQESEWVTRKQLVDKALRAGGWREYESAEQLLQRINASRTNETSTPARGLAARVGRRS